MQDRYIADEAKVNISSLEAETVMKSTPVSTVTSKKNFVLNPGGFSLCCPK